VSNSAIEFRYVFINYDIKGIVDYVSDEGSSASDRALTLAEEIAQNGMQLHVS
jgi:hypothetical protein